MYICNYILENSSLILLIYIYIYIYISKLQFNRQITVHLQLETNDNGGLVLHVWKTDC